MSTVSPPRRGIHTDIVAKFSCWLEMQFDRAYNRKGICWCRVKGGFGSQGRTENWIAGLPCGAVNVSVSRNIDSAVWDGGASTLGAAMDNVMDRAVRHSECKIAGTVKELSALHQGLETLWGAR